MAKAKGNKKGSSTSTTAAPTPLSVLAFDGIDDRIELSKDFPSIEKAITIEFWAQGQNSLGQQTTVIEAYNAQNARVLNIHFPWQHVADSRIFWDAGNDDNGFDRIDKAVKLEEYNVWTHWAFVKDTATGKMSIYRDGEIWHQGDGHHKSLAGIAKFAIGSFVNASYYWKGLLAEFRIWNQARTQAEIQQNKNSRLMGTEAGLVGYWPLDEGSGATLEDKTANGNHGTIHGNPSWVESEQPILKDLETAPESSPAIDYVLTFNGQDNFITCPEGIVTSSYTKEAWVKLAEPLAQYNNILSGHDHALYMPNGGCLESGHNSQWGLVKDSSTSPPNTWRPVAVTYDSQTKVMCLYRDGGLVSQASDVPPFTPSDGTLLIGSHLSSALFKGQMAEARVWNKVLSQTDIQSNLSHRLVGNEPGLVGYWPLNDGSGTIAQDKTSNANHGTIHGNPTWEVSTLSLADATPSPSEDKEASSSPETPTQASPAPTSSENSPTVNLPTGSKIKLKSWKGDYLHRPDSAQGVTAWDTGVGNEWTVEAIADGKIKLKSWKGDYLHRPDSAQGVTTWSTGEGNEWTVEAIADNKIKLKSWKGDYLHRPDSPPDVTTWNTGVGNEWEFEVISIEEPAGSASASPNVSPSPSTLPPEQLAELIHPVPILSEGYANEQPGELGEAASAPPNVAPLPPQPSVESDLPVTPIPIAPPIPPVRLQGRQMVLVLDDKHQGISAGGGALRPQGRFTIEAWVYPATNAGKQVIFAEGGTLFYLEGGELKFQATPAAEAISSVGAGLVAGNWYHVAVARAGSRPGDTKLYINGVHNDNQRAITPVLSFGNSYLGGQPDVSDSGFQGKLLEVRVWRFARSQAEIEANRLYPMTGRELGLVRCWSLNKTVGSTLHDKTTNRAVGTLSGDAVWEEVEIPLKLKLDPQERLTRSTGLEDYGYWFKEMAKQQKTEADPPFLRGRIWA